MKIKAPKQKGARGTWTLVVLAVAIFGLAGLIIGGFNFALDVLKNTFIGFAAGLLLRAFLLLLTKGAKGKGLKKAIGR